MSVHAVFGAQPVVFVDLETTGANPLHDRITEIGLVALHEGGVESWSSLVNPGVPIPPFIQSLTGINDAMVATAPGFAELAETVQTRLQGCLFFAHNARFDYGFLKNEFRRLGLHFQARVLCTVQLSKKLYPHEHKHNLDILTSRHGLQAGGERHRALTDADLLRQFLSVAAGELGVEAVQAAVAELTRLPPWPEGLDPALMDELPETPGVFVCYGEFDVPLFVGSAGNVRKEVLAHFAGKRKLRRELPLLRFTRRLEWFETSGDFGSALLESRLLRELAPQYNPPQPSLREPCCWGWQAGSAELALYSLFDAVPDGLDLFGPFRNRREAQQVLNRQAEAQGLCKRVLGLEPARPDSPACAGLALGKCKGACVGREALSSHQARLLAGLARYRLPAWPFPGPIGIAEGPEWAPVLQVFDRWRYLGSLQDLAELPELLLASPPPLDPELMKLLRSELKKPATRLVRLT